MKISKIDSLFEQIANDKHCELIIDTTYDKDEGYAIVEQSIIMLSDKWTNPLIKKAVFCHELGHVIVFRKLKKQKIQCNVIETEIMAWIEGMKLHKAYFNKTFTQTQIKFMLLALQSYAQTKSSFKTTK